MSVSPGRSAGPRRAAGTVPGAANTAMANRRTLTAVARDLQRASNVMAILNRDQSRDTILAGIYAGEAKGIQAAKRLDARSVDLKARQADVDRYRAELGALLDGLDK